MNQTKWLIVLFSTLVVFSSIFGAKSAWSQTAENQGALVGRITTIEGGQLLRYVPVEKDWVVTVKDTPVAPTDSLFSADDTKAELAIQDNSLIRVGGETQLELVELGQGVTQADAASGKARFWNRSEDGLIRVTTPYGYVVAPAGSVFDLYVGEKTLEVVSISGTVDFIHDADQSKYEVTAGSSSVIANNRIVTTGPGEAAEEWQSWNQSRDSSLAKRNEAKSGSAQHLPRQLQEYRSDLDQNGKWETVNYGGKSYNLWHPAEVEQDWAPFTVGAWMDYYGDNAWVPGEPFGYITMHYGNWLFVDNHWFWAPPGIGIVASSGCDACWVPGRVAWLYTDADVGWLPLAPTEPFYAFNRWGPGIIVVNNENINNITININNFQFADHAVIIDQRSLFASENYGPMRRGNVNGQTIAAEFHGAPVLSNGIVKDYSSKQRFTVTKQAPTFKPGPDALNRIAHNEGTVKKISAMDPKSIQHMVAAAKPGQITPKAGLSPPSLHGKQLNTGGVKIASVPSGLQSGKTGSSGVSKTGSGSGEQTRISRPQTPPPPKVSDKTALKHGTSQVSHAGKTTSKEAAAGMSKTASSKSERTKVTKSHTAPRLTAAQKAGRDAGLPSAEKAGKSSMPRSDNTKLGSKSSKHPSGSESSAMKQPSHSFTEHNPQTQTPTTVTPKQQVTTPGMSTEHNLKAQTPVTVTPKQTATPGMSSPGTQATEAKHQVETQKTSTPAPNKGDPSSRKTQGSFGSASKQDDPFSKKAQGASTQGPRQDDSKREKDTGAFGHGGHGGHGGHHR